MNYIIVEDEYLSAERLAKMVKNIRRNYSLLTTLPSVSSAVNWLKQNPHPQFAFFDIQLADGLCFEIFEKTDVDFPIIFTTAFNEYAIRAFKVNSIDYLLKPINENELAQSILKLERLQQPVGLPRDVVAEITRQLSGSCYRKRFLIKVGEHIKTVEIDNVSMFHSMDKATFLKTADGRDYGIEFSLELLEKELDPILFFRVNRSTIISKGFIRDIVVYSNSRLKVTLTVAGTEPIVVSRERVTEFKQWLER